MNTYYIHQYLSEHENFTQKIVPTRTLVGLPTKLVKNPLYSTNIIIKCISNKCQSTNLKYFKSHDVNNDEGDKNSPI